MIFNSIFVSLRRHPRPEKGAKPKLMLYTKDPCPLCDDLVEELRPHWDRFELEKVYITENVRHLRMYRYDIPVLFLDNEFVCMHRLDEGMLLRKLKEFEDRRDLDE